MIVKKKIGNKKRTIVEFKKDIFISSFDVFNKPQVLITFSDKTKDYLDVNGELDLDRDYPMKGHSFGSLDPKVVLTFLDPKSIRNLIELLSDAEKLLTSKIDR